MNITKIDYSQYIANAKKVKESKLKWKPQLPASFLDHTLPILASINLELTDDGLISTTGTFTKLQNIEVLNTPNGKMTGANVLRLIMFLYLCKRGDLVHGSQNKSPKLGALTPILLYAHKLYNNVPYNKWDKNDNNVKYALGSYLEGILKIDKLPNPKDYDLVETRNEALTYKSGNRAGELSPITGHKCNIKRIGDIDLPNVAMFMILQLWLANAAIRNVDSMILHPINWGEVPAPLDTAIPQISSKEAPDDITQWI